MASRIVSQAVCRYRPKPPAPDLVFVGSIIFLAMQIPRAMYDMTTEIRDAHKNRTSKKLSGR